MDTRLGVSGDWFWTRPTWELLRQFAAAAVPDGPLLVTGERGTGKTHVARLIHRWSLRKERPLVVVDGDELSGVWFEIKLFGYVRGAFIGAEADQLGKLGEAAEGTLVLDEIDRLPLEDQDELLGVLRRRTYDPVGAHQPRSLGARVIATTSRALGRELAAGRFCSELYDLFREVQIQLPALRRNRESIRPLARKFLHEFGRRCGRSECCLTGEAWEALEAYDWPGNVGELRRVLEQAVTRCRNGLITSADLTESPPGHANPRPAAWEVPASCALASVG